MVENKIRTVPMHPLRERRDVMRAAERREEVVHRDFVRQVARGSTDKSNNSGLFLITREREVNTTTSVIFPCCFVFAFIFPNVHFPKRWISSNSVGRFENQMTVGY
jgi:hypothetical protein